MYQDYEEELKIIPYMINNNLWWDENNDFSEQWKLNVKQYKKNKKKKAVNALSKRINEENSQTNPTVALSRRNRRSVVRRMSSRSNTDRITDRNFINTVISIPHYNENRENYVNPYGQIISPGQVRRGYIRR
jgi:ATP-dependent Lon protease